MGEGTTRLSRIHRQMHITVTLPTCARTCAVVSSASSSSCWAVPSAALRSPNGLHIASVLTRCNLFSWVMGRTCRIVSSEATDC
jgi:hypothetical protein